MTTRTQINKWLKNNIEGLELFKGAGYFYFEYDHDGYYGTRSVFVYKMADLSLDNWKAEARNALEEIVNHNKPLPIKNQIQQLK